MNPKKEALNAALDAVMRHNWISPQNREILVSEAVEAASRVLLSAGYDEGYDMGYGDGYAVDGRYGECPNPYKALA